MPHADETSAPYTVHIDEEHWRVLESCSERRLEEVLVFLRDHGSRTPTARIPGKLKQLRGRYRGHFQFTIDRDHKGIYTMDEEQRQVRLEYVGPHPDWRKSRRGRIRS